MLNIPFTKIISNTLKASSLVLSSALFFSTASAEITYQQDFEKGGKFEFKRYGTDNKKGGWFWDTFKNSANHPTIEQAPQRSGKAGKFYLSKDGTGTTLRNKNWDGKPTGNRDAKCKSGVECTSRTEITVTDQKGHFELGKEYWLNLDYRYEHWEKEVEVKPERDYMIGPLQVHTRRSKGCSDGYGSATYHAPFLMKAYGNELRFLTRGAKVLWRGDIKLKQWVNVVVHFKLSYSGDGFIEVWQDGKKLGKVTGANYVEFDKCDGRMRSGFFKMGLYNAAWEVPKNPGLFKNVEREIWIDNLKIGTGYPDSVGTPPKEDTKVPSTPNNLKASGISTNSINLNWSASSDNVGVSGYEVHYKVTNDSSVKIKTASSNSTTLTGLNPNSTYSMRVRALDATNNKSGFSNYETAVTKAEPVDDIPPKVSNINAQVSSEKTVVTWKTNVPTKAIVVFYAKDVAPKHLSVKTYVTSGNLEIPKSHLVENKKYTYYVRVTDQKGTKTQSANFNFVTTQNPVDPVPSYTVSYIATTGGTLTGSATQTVKKGQSASSVTAVAINGYTFVGWSDGKISASRTDTNITSNLTFRATFSKNTGEPDEPTTPEPTQDKTEEDSAGGSFPISLLMLGLLAFLRRK